ncbi:DNA-binding response regulator [Streptomyces profundus]|uniref:DNA-binding response regulator n=1 Tax=Streptomyces profundus TaxID=2867410 RepID=UPI001D16A182|nr:DNA-binding response regulator [Streptomyces sp. MA3_2.13]UED85095.1 DNA-binding response regulator [Streptomyces sp. MA3_2.13]
MEQALLQARALIRTTVSVNRRQIRTPSAVVRMAAARLGELLGEHLPRAQHSVVVALNGVSEFTDAVLATLNSLPSEVTVRVLYTTEASRVTSARLQHIPEHAEARVSNSDLREVLVVDGSTALVWADQRAPYRRVTTITDPAAVRTVELLFASAWTRGHKLADHLRLGPWLQSELKRQILQQLRFGYTDEVAAREINVSLRTYRRHVAEIMREVDASSRFQAGVRAAQLGLLSGLPAVDQPREETPTGKSVASLQ